MQTLDRERGPNAVSTSSEAQQALDHIAKASDARLNGAALEVRSNLSGHVNNAQAFVDAAIVNSCGDDLRAAINELGLTNLGALVAKSDAARLQSPVDSATILKRREQPNVIIEE